MPRWPAAGSPVVATETRHTRAGCKLHFRDLRPAGYTPLLPQPAPSGACRRRGCPKEVERIVRAYELMTIYRPELAESDVRSEHSRVEAALQEGGAEITASDFWGKRRFAYEIQHIHEGYYTLVAFTAEPDAIELVDRALTLSDNVVRHKFIRPE